METESGRAVKKVEGFGRMGMGEKLLECLVLVLKWELELDEDKASIGFCLDDPEDGVLPF